jgi:hypothetical protein
MKAGLSNPEEYDADSLGRRLADIEKLRAIHGDVPQVPPVEGMKKGGAVTISNNPDTMFMELMDRHFAGGGAIKALTKALAKKSPKIEQTAKSLNLRPSEFDAYQKAFEQIQESGGIPRSMKEVAKLTGKEEDIARSMMTNPVFKAKGLEQIPVSSVEEALANRNRYRAEPARTPGPKASEKEWAEWGAKHGVNMTVTPDVSLGISDLTTGREVKIPGGLEGTFTIPDMFKIKAMNIDPSSLPKDVHDQLMKKFIRTHKIENPDEVDMFNRLNFALLSPNAPLTPNEFLAQRARLVNMDELKALAGRVGEPNLSKTADLQLGTGAAGRGGMGVSGTADLGNQAMLAKLILEKPEMFKLQPNETMRDVTTRVMNQVPGLGPKTASLGTPWLDLEKANTSAVDLHMIRNAYKRMLDDPQVGEAFRNRMSALLKTEPTTESILKADLSKVEEAAINVIGGTQLGRMYRLKTGELNNIPSVATPEKLAYEPKVFQDFNPFYSKVVDYVDESRGQNPILELFPEQWRKWDMYRGRIEPHEFAHPDFRKLPRQSWSEMADALQAHKNAGYTQANTPVMKESDWRELYYGGHLPLPILGAEALSNQEPNTKQNKPVNFTDNPDTMFMELHDKKFAGGGLIRKIAEKLGTKMIPAMEAEANKAKFLEPSKVKDVMYHGTNVNLNEFRPNDKNAHFVTPSAKFADDFLGDYQGYENGENILPVYVQASNPFDFENKNHIKNLENLLDSRKFFYKPVKEMMPRIKRGHWEALEFPSTMNAIKELGHDSMHVLEADREGEPVKNLAIFNPNKIKSAIGNQGTYDTTNPDITKKRGGLIHAKRHYGLGGLVKALTPMEEALAKMKALKQAMAPEIALNKRYEEATKDMYTKDMPSFEEWKKSLPPPEVK